MVPHPTPPPNATGRTWRSVIRRVFTRANTIAIALVCASVAAVLAVTLHFVRQDSQERFEQFAAERLQQVVDTARLAKKEIDGIGRDLWNAIELVQGDPEHPAVYLEAVHRFTVEYEVVRLYDDRVFEDGDPAPIVAQAGVMPRSLSPEKRALIDTAMRDVARRALRASPRVLFATAPVAGSLRVFAMASDPGPRSAPPVVLAVLLDTERYFEKLHTLTRESTSGLLLLGFDGRPVPPSDELLVRRVNEVDAEPTGAGELRALVLEPMRAGKAGAHRMSPEESSRFGLGDAQVFVAYAPISIRGATQGPWSVAILSSTSTINTRDSAVAWRLTYAGGAVCLLIIGFALYVMAEMRRISGEYLRQEREHSSSLSTLLEQRQEAETALQSAKDAAEAASRSKSEFLANVSHEIRTPMNGIIGLTNLALGTELSREQKDILEMVKGSADSLLLVINDILDFSKIEAGKFDLDQVPFGLDETISDTLKTLAFSAHQKGIDLIYHVDAAVPDALIGDSLRIRQVLVNLVGNAIKFTKRGEISVRVVSERAEGDEVILHFSVEDTGIGIPVEMQKVIFEPFAQGDGSTTRKYGGTGLGLAICVRLCEMMGGGIRVESRPGQGSTFRFDVRARVQEEQPEVLEAPELHDLSILVVDFNATRRAVLEEVLEGWGARPVIVGDADDALDLVKAAEARGAPFGLLLIDAVLAEMSGLELAEQIRAETPCTAPMVMMMTAVTRRPDTELCRTLNIVEYVTRPIRPVHLLAALATAVSGGAATAARLSRYPDEGPRLPRAPLSILLAEDNPVNQALAVRLLVKEGHAIDVVGTGRDALLALERRAFDLVLMDVQMPEMDGLEAIAEIRSAENQRPGAHLPVIAMTAFTMRGDRERFLESGFDGYVKKPIDVRELLDAIDALIPRDRGRGEPAGPSIPPPPRVAVVREVSAPFIASPLPVVAPSPAPPAVASASMVDPVPFDVATALRRAGGDEEILKDIIGVFLEEWPGWIAEIDAAVTARDAPRLKRAAHTLKGAVDNCGASAAWDAARRLEKMGHEAALEGAGEALAELRGLLERLVPALDRYAKS